MHAERALAYDVAVGVCRIKQHQLRKLRVAADWRLLDGLDKDNPAKAFKEYFAAATIHEVSTSVWIHRDDCEASLPVSIVDKRENSAPSSRPNSGELAHG